MLGAAWIAERALLPAIAASRNGRLLALASRDPARGRMLAARHAVPRVYADYRALLEDPEVDAVYLPLVNSLHREWTLRALAAGKHVLCEKPLAIDAGQGEEMAAAAEVARKLLMEAFMYRFHPRIRGLRDELSEVLAVDAAFGFPIDAAGGSYRLSPWLGGGALLDVGCYVVDVARWLTGEEPLRVAAVGSGAPVEMSISAILEFPSGAQASAWASFESPEHQTLTVVTRSGVRRLEQPFTAWRDPHDPYQLMVEAFAEAAILGRPAPIAPGDSIGTLRALDRVREAAGLASGSRRA